MFKKDNRYVTRGVNDEVDIRIQMIIWSMCIGDTISRP